MKNLLAAIWLVALTACASAQQVVTLPYVPPSGNAIGPGIDFSTKPSALFIQPSGSIQNGAPWSVTFGIESPGFPSAVTTSVLVAGQPISSASTTTGFFVGNFGTITTNLGLQFNGYIRPYPAPTNCASNGVVCVRGTRIANSALNWFTWTYDGQNSVAYLNGQQTDASIATQIFAPGTSYWQIGQALANMKITEFAYYPVALSASDVASLYALNSHGFSAATGPLTQRLIYIPTTDCDSSGCPDDSGNGHNGFYDTTPPVVAVATPTNGATVTGPIDLTATCTDTIICTSVAWKLDGYIISTPTVAPFTYTLLSQTLVDGPHQITAFATNAGNQTAQATITITTSNGVAAKSVYFAAASSSPPGNDSNNCLSTSTPCLSPTKMNSLTYHGGDSILIHAGDTIDASAAFPTIVGIFSGRVQNYFPAGSAYPLTISTYGSGTCATIAGTITGCGSFSSGSQLAGIELFGASNAQISNLRFIGNATAMASTEVGNGIFLDGTMDSVNIVNVEVIDWADLIYVDGGSGAITNWSIKNSQLHGSTAIQQVDNGIWVRFGATSFGLLEGNNIFNIGGRAGGLNYYPGCCGNGILIADGAHDITDHFNVVAHFGRNTITCGGPAGNWTFGVNNIELLYNESYDGNPTVYTAGCDWDGFDLDGQTTNTEMAFGYAHNNYGSGLAIYDGAPWFGNRIHHNISENDSLLLDQGAMDIGVANLQTQHSAIFNNTVFQTNGTSASVGFCLGIFGETDFVFADNNCTQTGGAISVATASSSIDLTGMTLKNNNYWSATQANTSFRVKGVVYTSLAAYQVATGNDVGSVAVDPQYQGETTAAFTATIGTPATGTSSGSSIALTGITGLVSVGDLISVNACVPANTSIASQVSGPTGGNGTYTTNNATTCSATLLSITSNVLNVTSSPTVTLAVGNIVSSSLSGGAGITALGTGTGGAGTYVTAFRNTTRVASTSFRVFVLGMTCYPGGIPLGPQGNPVGCPTSYKLRSTSPLIGAGADLTSLGVNMGTVDYYGNPTPNGGPGSGYNIGAYGGQ